MFGGLSDGVVDEAALRVAGDDEWLTRDGALACEDSIAFCQIEPGGHLVAVVAAHAAALEDRFDVGH